jgi:hypothetical protein
MTIPYTKANLTKATLTLSSDQHQCLYTNVMGAIRHHKNGKFKKNIVVSAFMGSGKTYTYVNTIIPAFLLEHGKAGTIVYVFSPVAEVVDAVESDLKGLWRNQNSKLKAHETATKTVNGVPVYLYSQDEFNELIKAGIFNDNGLFSQKPNAMFVVCLTSQFLVRNYDNLPKPDLVVFDEAHLVVGCPDKSVSKEDKGAYSKYFDPKTYKAYFESGDITTVMFSATTTNSQKELTVVGMSDYYRLPDMARDTDTTPFLDFCVYGDTAQSLREGLESFERHVTFVKNTLHKLTSRTQSGIGTLYNEIYAAPAVVVKFARANASTSGESFVNEEQMIRDYCKNNGYVLFISTSDNKEFDGKTVSSMDAGIKLANNKVYREKPLVIAVIESGTAGMDLPRIDTIVFGREKTGDVHNNPSQAAGRGLRMKWGFRNHKEAIQAFKNLDIEHSQLLLLLDLYCAVSTTTVHGSGELYAGSKKLTKKNRLSVREFLEYDSYDNKAIYSAEEGKEYIMSSVLDGDITEVISRELIDDSIPPKGSKCEVCDIDENGDPMCLALVKAYLGKHYPHLLSDDVDEVYRTKVLRSYLDRHHSHGNHFDHSKIVTQCKNTHALETYINEHFNNRYEF